MHSICLLYKKTKALYYLHIKINNTKSLPINFSNTNVEYGYNET